jgi:predicted DNA-binding transcriptional regulator AlpA
LEKWRSQNCGPRYCKLGNKAVRYRKSDIDNFIAEGFGTQREQGVFTDVR